MYRALLFCLCLAISSTVTAQGVLGRLVKRGNAGGRERSFRVVKGERMGAYLAENFAGKRIVVLLPAEAPMLGDGVPGELPQVAVLEGLEKGLGGKLTIVGKIQPKMPGALKARMRKAMQDNKGMMMDGQAWFGVTELNEELKPYEGKYDILVCLAGLPGVERPMGNPRSFVPVTELSAIRDPKVVLAIVEGGIARFGRLVHEGKIVAAISHRRDMQDKDYDLAPAGGVDSAFAIRYVLITPANVRLYRNWFGR